MVAGTGDDVVGRAGHAPATGMLDIGYQAGGGNDLDIHVPLSTICKSLQPATHYRQ